MIKSDTITKISMALLKAQKTMGEATKGAKNPFFKSSYADLNSIREVAIPALNAQGVTVLQPTSQGFVETVLLHESGEWISGFTEIKNLKGDAQGEGSGISYARRYGLQSILSIGAVDDDGEAAQGRSNGKTQEYVGNSQTTTQLKQESIQSREVSQNQAKPTQEQVGQTEKSNKPTRELITATFKVLEAQKKITKEEFKTKYQKGKGLSTLTDVEMNDILKTVKQDFKL